jgi:RNA polymerase sigma-70 factor (ECF subfamily)
MDPVSPSPFEGGQPRPTYAELECLSDDQLMARLQAGCHDALAVLFDRYHRLIFSIALKILRDPGEAEDVMQNVFLDIFRAMAQFDPSRGSTKVWMSQYAYHRAISRRQYLNTRRFYSQEGFEDVESVLPQSNSVVGKFTPGELKHMLKEGLATLNAPQRRVIELASYEGLSMQEIADKTGESLVNVRHHYYRGLRKLRSLLAGPSEMRKAAGDE